MDKLIYIGLFNIDSYRYDTDIGTVYVCYAVYLHIILLLSYIDGYN